MDNNIKIVRFKDCTDVICKIVHDSKGVVVMEDPMWFEVRNAQLAINQWLPIAITKNNSVTIKDADILCIFEPNQEFEEYYMDLVGNINKALKTKLVDKEDRIEEAKALLEALNEMNITKDVTKH